MNKSFLFIFMLLLSLRLVAQEERATKHKNLKLAFEFGTNVTSGKLVKPEQIRENYSQDYYYGDDYYNYGFFVDGNSLRTTYFGLKPEFFISNNRIGIASGLRFTMASSELVSDRNNFLWKVKEEGLNTDYVRINDIRHQSYLLGVPVEIRFFPNNRELPFQHYFRLGASLNYRIYSDNQVNFTSFAMKKYDDLVQSQLPNNYAFSASLYGSIGFKIGMFKEGRWIPWGNIDFMFPYIMLCAKSFAFVGNNRNEEFFPGVGFQVSFQIPIGKNVPMGSKLK